MNTNEDTNETFYPADPKEVSNDGDPIHLMHEQAIAELTGERFVWRG